MTPQDPPADPAGRVLNERELAALYRPNAARWPALGVTVALDPDRPAVEGETVPAAKVFAAGEQIGHLIESDRFPGLPVFVALITDDWPVAFPHGFLPPDPIQAREGEQRRWLSPDHADHPNHP
ncbi:hypothetical protein ACWGHM_40340 [Streptomyces sp. NPDC054904]